MEPRIETVNVRCMLEIDLMLSRSGRCHLSLICYRYFVCRSHACGSETVQRVEFALNTSPAVIFVSAESVSQVGHLDELSLTRPIDILGQRYLVINIL